MLIYPKYGADLVNTSKVTNRKTKWACFEPPCNIESGGTKSWKWTIAYECHELSPQGGEESRRTNIHGRINV